MFSEYTPQLLHIRVRNIPERACNCANANTTGKDWSGSGIDLTGCLAVPTNQHADTDLVNVGQPVEAEKDRLLNVFVDFAATLCNKLRSQGHWADYIDPCSGLPMLSGGNKVYSEVEGMQLLLQYQVMNAGMCRVLLHPLWGSAVYPASCFTTAPIDVVTRALQEHLPEQ
eukprot:12511-Heterococcus_DN1.PRE.2